MITWSPTPLMCNYLNKCKLIAEIKSSSAAIKYLLVVKKESINGILLQPFYKKAIQKILKNYYFRL